MLPHHVQGSAHYLARCRCFVVTRMSHLPAACRHHLIDCLDFHHLDFHRLGFHSQGCRCLGCHCFHFDFPWLSCFHFRSSGNRSFDHSRLLNLRLRWNSHYLGLRCCYFLFHFRWSYRHYRMFHSHLVPDFDLACLVRFHPDHSVDRMIVHL